MSEEIDPIFLKLGKIFLPEAARKLVNLRTGDNRFVYYTSASVAKSIIENKKIWMRNAQLMNDFSEIQYGVRLLRTALVGSEGEEFRNLIENRFPGVLGEVLQLAQGWESDWVNETYLTCISEHDETEDRDGRLSMWRAYGDVALVMRNAPFKAVSDALGLIPRR